MSSHRKAVRRLTHRLGPNFSVGFRFLPEPKRRAVYAAYAVCRVADDIVDEVEPGAPVDAARAELDAFAAEVEAAYAGRPTTDVTRALTEALERFDIPKDAFLGLIEGCRWDLERHRYATWDELERYCELVAVTISDISLAIFGTVDERAPDYGRHLALALQLTNICRDVGEDTGRGRIYLPAEALADAGVGEEAILARRDSPAFRALMSAATGRAAAHFAAANPLPEAVHPDARLGVRLMGLIYSTILRRIQAAPERVLTTRVRLSRPAKAAVVLRGLLRRPFWARGRDGADGPGR